MSRSTITVMTCDRCHERHEIRSEDEIYAWGKFYARQLNGPFEVKTAPNPKGEPPAVDICKECLRSLETWWEVGGIKIVNEEAA